MSSMEIVRGLLGAWEARDLAKAASYMTDDFVLTGPAPVPLNKDAYLTFQSVHNDAFSDWKFNITAEKETGDTVHFELNITGTNDGVFNVGRIGLPIPPVPPTGKAMRWATDNVTATVRNGKVVSVYIELGPHSGVIGTLERMGIALPSMA